MNRQISIFIATAATFAALAPAAGATTFCVPTYHPACPDNGSNVAEANLETAMQTQSSDGIADTVSVAAGTQTDSNSLQASGTDPLTVDGAGPAQTKLTTASDQNIYIVDLNTGNSRDITMRDLTIEIPAAMAQYQGFGIQVSDDTLENVDIVSLNDDSSAAASWVGGGTWRGGEIRGASGGTIHNGVLTSQSGTVVVEGLTIRDAASAVTNSSPTSTLNVRQSRIVKPQQVAVAASAGTTNVENLVIETENTYALSAFANSANDVTLNADHVTAIDDGGNISPVSSHVGSGNDGDTTVTVSNSIFRGYAYAWMRVGQTGADGAADLTIRHSNFPPASATPGPESDTGDGTLAVTEGNIDADPLFAGAGDYRLLAGSPSIDAGAPGTGTAVDVVGVTRPIDGNADGTPVRDQGAYEFVPAAPPPPPPPADVEAPETIKGAGPKAKSAKRKATFAFSSEPGASFRCALDGAQPKPCSSPAKVRRLRPGKHTFRAFAVDAAGNADQSPATWKFKVKRKR